MTERIGEADALRAPPVDAAAFLTRPGVQGPLRGCGEIVHHEVQVHRRPVPGVIALQRQRAHRVRAGGVAQQIESGGGAAEFGDIVVEEAAQLQAEGGRVEVDRRGEFRDVEVDDHAHGSTTVHLAPGSCPFPLLLVAPDRLDALCVVAPPLFDQLDIVGGPEVALEFGRAVDRDADLRWGFGRLEGYPFPVADLPGPG
ncbi:hypothetical protein D3C86_1542150 [compost metagenome]